VFLGYLEDHRLSWQYWTYLRVKGSLATWIRMELLSQPTLADIHLSLLARLPVSFRVFFGCCCCDLTFSTADMAVSIS